MRRIGALGVLLALIWAVFCAAETVPAAETTETAPAAAAEPAETTAPEPETEVFWDTEIRPGETEVTFAGGGRADLAELEGLLARHPDLRRVNLFEKQVALKEVRPLMDRHPEVEFGMTLQLNPSHILRTDMTAYSTLGRQPQITKAQTWYFTCLKRLKALDIGHMNVHSLDFLAETPKLKILIVADNGLKDRDIQALAEQTELEYLEIFKNYVTDLSPLRGMTELRDLNIGYNDIRDLSPLDGLDKLERLWTMGNWWLPEEEIERFRSLHPDCEVVTWSYGATGNRMDKNKKQDPGTSWRHHPHYDTIHWIFDHSEYIGWDVPVPQVKTAEDP